MREATWELPSWHGVTSVTSGHVRRHRPSVPGVIKAELGSAYAADIDPVEVAEMLTGEMAKYQIQDRVREAEQGRLAKSSQVRRSRARSAATRSVASGLLATATGLWRKTTPTATPVRVKLA